jgi:hypothetical protein
MRDPSTTHGRAITSFYVARRQCVNTETLQFYCCLYCAIRDPTSRETETLWVANAINVVSVYSWWRIERSETCSVVPINHSCVDWSFVVAFTSETHRDELFKSKITRTTNVKTAYDYEKLSAQQKICIYKYLDHNMSNTFND